MDETRKSPKVKAILLAAIAIIFVLIIGFMSQCDALLSDLCWVCNVREATKGKYCDVCHEKTQNIFETMPTYSNR